MSTWHLLGLGSLGTLTAARLLAAGENVRVLPRTPCKLVSRTLVRPNQAPLTLSLPCAADEPIERLVVTVKGPDTRSALAPWIARLADNAVMVCLQNGIGAIEQVALPDTTRVIHAVSTDGAWRDADQIFVVAENDTRMGDGSPEMPPWFATLQRFWSGLIWSEDIQWDRWRKLAVNAVINPLTALYQCRNGELLDGGEHQQALQRLAEEVDLVAAARLPDWPNDTPSRAAEIALATAENTSSMLADVQAGRVTEIDYINGFLLHQALQLGLHLPAHQRLYTALTD